MGSEDKVRELLEVTINKCNTCNGDSEIDCIDCTLGGRAELARQILKLLYEDNQ